jgi:threonine dehydratase
VQRPLASRFTGASQAENGGSGKLRPTPTWFPKPVITRKDVLSAHRRIKGYVRRTPLLRAKTPSEPLWLKCEFLQHTGVFKARGAFNRLLAARARGELDPTVGVVIASGGNAGLANAYAAATLGIRATVFVPETAPSVKIERIREYGADVKQVGSEYAEASEAAADYANVRGALLSHAYDHPEIAAGAGTLAEEMFDDEPSIETIVVAVGGGGLYAGIAAVAEGRARVVTSSRSAARPCMQRLRLAVPSMCRYLGWRRTLLGPAE